jgi:hypothetical protein
MLVWRWARLCGRKARSALGVRISSENTQSKTGGQKFPTASPCQINPDLPLSPVSGFVHSVPSLVATTSAHYLLLRRRRLLLLLVLLLVLLLLLLLLLLVFLVRVSRYLPPSSTFNRDSLRSSSCQRHRRRCLLSVVRSTLSTRTPPFV